MSTLPGVTRLLPLLQGFFPDFMHSYAQTQTHTCWKVKKSIKKKMKMKEITKWNTFLGYVRRVSHVKSGSSDTIYGNWRRFEGFEGFMTKDREKQVFIIHAILNQMENFYCPVRISAWLWNLEFALKNWNPKTFCIFACLTSQLGSVHYFSVISCISWPIFRSFDAHFLYFAARLKSSKHLTTR